MAARRGERERVGAAASGVKAVPSPDARAAHRAEHQAKLDAAEARVMGQGIAKPGAPATKGPTPLQAHKIETLADFHHQRATRGDVSSAADRSEMPAHALAARVYREAAKGGDVNAALHKADAEWRAHAAKVSADIKAAPKTKMGPYSGQSVMRDHWANPDKFSHMAPEIRANVARELAAQHAPMAEARHAAWKIGEAQKWAAISKADRAQHEAGMNPTTGTKLAAAAAHREAAAAMRSAPEQHAPDHPMHAREKARVEEHAKWREEHATKLEAEAHAVKQKAAADSAAAKVAKEERRADRAKVAAGKTAAQAAEQALRGGPALNPATGSTIKITTRNGNMEVPVIHRQGDYALHYALNGDGSQRSGGSGKMKELVVTHTPTGLNIGSLAGAIKSNAEGKSVIASLNHPDFKKALDAWASAPKTNNGRETRAIQETWHKVKPVPVERVSTKRAVAMLSTP